MLTTAVELFSGSVRLQNKVSEALRHKKAGVQQGRDVKWFAAGNVLNLVNF